MSAGEKVADPAALKMCTWEKLDDMCIYKHPRKREKKESVLYRREKKNLRSEKTHKIINPPKNTRVDLNWRSLLLKMHDILSVSITIILQNGPSSLFIYKKKITCTGKVYLQNVILTEKLKIRSDIFLFNNFTQNRKVIKKKQSGGGGGGFAYYVWNKKTKNY